jgi:hypothetical protein
MKILHNNIEILNIQVDDSSYRYRAIKGDHNLTLYFSLAEHVEIPVGAYCVYENETYTLEKPESLTMKHSRYFEYTVVFDSPQAKAGKWKFRNPVDRRLKFPLTAKPIEHLQMFVDNMNQRDSGWTIGRCIDAPEKTISYNHAYCIDALSQMADEWETEYEFVGKQVSLWKVEYNRDNPLPLSYGKGNGFKPGIGRSNYEDSTPIEILYIQGGEQNIDASQYGSSELLLPKSQTIRFDGEHFEGEQGFDSSKARTYQTDADGFSIRRADKPLSSQAEDSLDCSEIYPSRVGTISAVTVVDASKHFYDIVDSSIPASLNFEDCLIEGETLTIIPQTGMLAGKEFEAKYIHNAKEGKAARRFEIVPQDIDGQTMPGGNYIPQVGDTYAVFHCMLPAAYICDNATKTGASWDMFRQGVKYLYDNEEQKFTFTGELDGIWAKKDWLNIGGMIKLGGFVQFSDERFQPEGVLVRIIGIKDYINNPHSPEIELSNSTVGRTVSSDLRKIESNEVVMDTLHKEALQFTKRRYRDSMETIEMLGDALLDNFSNSINPIAVKTMAMLIGDKSLQFEFVNSMTNPSPVVHNVTYNQATKVLSVPAGIIQHYTLGIDTISSSHAADEYKFWSLPAFTTPTLTDGTKKYYLYAKVSKTAKTGTFYISEQAIAMEGVAGYYHLLMGVLNSEYDGERSYVSLYGFSEILPGRITTDKIVSSDGKTYFDLLLGEIGGNIKFASTDGSMKDVADLEKLIGDGNDVFTEQPIPPYKKGDLWVNGKVILKSTVSRESGEYVAADWVDAVEYDNTKTTIDGGIVTSGTIQLAGNDSTIKAGATGEGTADTSVRFWAGETKSQKTSAPFRVLQNGKLYASDVEIKGKVTATSGEFRGKVYASDGEFTGKVTATSGSFDGDIVAQNFKTIGPFQHHIESLTVSSTMGVISNFPYSFMRVTPSSNNQQLLISRSWGSKYEGRIVYIHNPHNSYNIQLVNGDYLTGSLGTFTLQPHGTIQLMWSQDSNDWIIISYYKTPDGWTA